jgi:DNA-binding transcriptional LysR family regulator
MCMLHEFLATLPFDLYELNLFTLVATSGSFTRAGLQAGLSQSALTRQIRGMEDRLGVELFERTTRHVALAPAGKLLLEKSSAILAAANSLLDELKHEFRLVPPVLRVGISPEIGLSMLPGFFVGFHRKHPDVQLRISQTKSSELLASVEAAALDAALLCPPPRLSRALQVTHRFADEFTLILPPNIPAPAISKPLPLARLKKMIPEQRWLLIDRDSNTGIFLHQWLRREGAHIEPAMELDNFDTIINLVSLGLGASLVPHRTLPLYKNRREVRRVLLKPRFTRDLAVVVRKNRTHREHLARFIQEVLF